MYCPWQWIQSVIIWPVYMFCMQASGDQRDLMQEWHQHSSLSTSLSSSPLAIAYGIHHAGCNTVTQKWLWKIFQMSWWQQYYLKCMLCYPCKKSSWGQSKKEWRTLQNNVMYNKYFWCRKYWMSICCITWITADTKIIPWKKFLKWNEWRDPWN